ncbi:hypothetical protein GCM10009077_06120 [Roseibium denhamense]|uniref:Uncharacterized protein n=1 Tax=Roseibium denhamense TaxID=76305 RepID=A0ABY1N5Z1_9HYPH|nr:hypothetical protein SAMN06265374_0330 [Roseibium denhamense]
MHVTGAGNRTGANKSVKCRLGQETARCVPSIQILTGLMELRRINAAQPYCFSAQLKCIAINDTDIRSNSCWQVCAED